MRTPFTRIAFLAVAIVGTATASAAPPVARLTLRLPGVERHDFRPPVVTAVTISPDGGRVAAGGDDHSVRVWDASTGQVLRTLEGHTDWVRAARFAKQSDRLATVAADHAICRWSLTQANRQPEARRLGGGPLHAVAWRPDGLALVTAGFGDTLRVFDLSNADSDPTQMACPCDDTRAVTYSPDGRWIAAAGRNGVVRLWDLVGSGGPRDLPGDGRRVRALAFSPDGTTLAAGGDGPAIRLWRFEAGELTATPTEILIRPGKVHALAFVDESLLASGGTRNEVRLWDTEAGSRRDVLRGHTGTVASLSVSADGRRLASGSFDTTIRVWDLDPPAPKTAAKPKNQR